MFLLVPLTTDLVATPVGTYVISSSSLDTIGGKSDSLIPPAFAPASDLGETLAAGAQASLPNILLSPLLEGVDGQSPRNVDGGGPLLSPFRRGGAGLA
jgi:hypothetical protein